MHSRTLKPRKNYPKHTELAVAPPDPNTSYSHMLEMVGERKKVLDVGCASGEFARLLVKRECDVVGIDVNPIAAEEARKFCTNVFVADLDETVMPALVGDRQFDVIIFGDLLEHLQEPARTLDESRALLSEHGYVVASIPNISHGAIRLALLSGRFDYQELGILDDSHLRFFTAKTIDELFLTAGFRIETIERVTLPLFSETDLVPVLDPRDFDDRTVADVKADPDSETLQFVLKAFPLSNDQRLRTISKRFLSANTELTAVKQQVARRESEALALRQTVESQRETMSRLEEQSRAADVKLEAESTRFRELENAYRGLELDSLAKQNAAIERTTAAQAEHARSIEAVAALQAKLEAAERELEDARAGVLVDARSPKLEELESGLRSLRDQLETQRARASTLEAERDDARQQVVREQRQTVLRELRVADALETRGELDAERERSERFKQGLVELQDRFSRELHAERSRAETLDERLAVLQTELAQSTERNDLLAADLASGQSEMAALAKEKLQAETQLDAARADMGSVSAQLTATQERASELQIETESLRVQSESFQARIAEVEAELRQSSERSDLLAGDLAAERERAVEMEQRARALQSNAEALESKITLLTNEHDRMEAGLRSERAEVAMLRNGKAQLETRVTVQQQESARQESLICAQRDRNGTLLGQITALRSAVESLEAEVAVASLTLTRSRAELQAGREKFAERIGRTEADCDELLTEAVAVVDEMRLHSIAERTRSESENAKQRADLAELESQMKAIRDASLADRLVMREYADDFRHRAERLQKEFESSIRQRDDLYIRVVENDRVMRESAEYTGKLEADIRQLETSLGEARVRGDLIEAELADVMARSEAAIAELTQRSEATVAELTAHSEATVAELTARSEATMAKLNARATSLEIDVAHQQAAMHHLRESADLEQVRANSAAAELASLTVRHEILQANLAEMDNLLVAQTEQLLASTSDERVRLLTLIDTVQSSRFWRLKHWMARLRVRLLGARS